ncbi:MAG: HAD family hydrolase [Nanoarchaeota archaeon]|nr:HAD family hydrolase [Nanoarchaeota archaeon]
MIIFDLDDTLIDTSGCFTPIKLRCVLKSMIFNGLIVKSEEEALKYLVELNKISINADEAIRTFLERFDAVEYLDIGIKEYYKDYNSDFDIDVLDNALEVLQQLKEKKHLLALVSYGNEELQMRKIKKSGLNLDIFNKVFITDKHNKEFFYESLARFFNFNFDGVVVCGDKFKTDILPAKKLGMKTIKMQWGRSLANPAKEDGADYSIKNLKEILNIVDVLNKK